MPLAVEAVAAPSAVPEAAAVLVLAVVAVFSEEAAHQVVVGSVHWLRKQARASAAVCLIARTRTVLLSKSRLSLCAPIALFSTPIPPLTR